MVDAASTIYLFLSIRLLDPRSPLLQLSIATLKALTGIIWPIFPWPSATAS